MDQNVAVPGFVGFVLTVGALIGVWLAPMTGLPLLIAATMFDRYRFEIAGAGFRIEHFVLIGVALAWGRSVIGGKRGRTFQRSNVPTFQRPNVLSSTIAKPFWSESVQLEHWGTGALIAFHRADLVLVAYLTVALISSWLFAPRVGESLKFVALMAFGVLLYWLVRTLATTDAVFRRGVWTLLAIGIAACAFGILAWLLFPFGINLGVQVYALPTFRTHSPYGTLFDANTFGIFAAMLALILATLLLDDQFAARRVWLAVGLGIVLVAIAVSLTRAAWLGLLVGMFVLAWFNPRRKWLLVIGGTVLALIVLALVVNSARATSGYALAEFSLARLLTSRSIEFRLDAYSRAFDDWLASPLLGNGANTFAQKYRMESGTRDWISNFLLMTLHDTGLVGLGLLGGWLIWLGYETWRALRASSPSQARTMVMALGLTYLMLLLAYQVTTLFWLGWNWALLGLLRAGTTVLWRKWRAITPLTD